MANNVTNKITIVATGLRTLQVRQYLKPAKPREGFEYIDFENVVRMPMSTKVGDIYNWRICHWGTRSNAYFQKEESFGEIWFDTIWTAPHEIIKEIAKQFPDVELHHEWADEDMGNNVGRAVYEDGKGEITFIQPQTEEAFEMYFKLHPGTREQYKLANGKYELIEE